MSKKTPDLNKTYTESVITTPTHPLSKDGETIRQQIALDRAREWLDEYGDSSVVALQSMPSFIL